MKRLSNVSPFLLLLFPVFVMMFLAFATVGNNQSTEEFATKTTANNTLAKVTAVIVK